MNCGDALPLYYLKEAPTVLFRPGFGQYQSRPHHQGPEEFPNRYVKGKRGLLENPIVSVETVRILHPHESISNRGVLHHHPFRSARGAGSENYVGKILSRFLQAWGRGSTENHWTISNHRFSRPSTYPAVMSCLQSGQPERYEGALSPIFDQGETQAVQGQAADMRPRS